MTSLSLSIQLSQCNLTVTESGNGGRENADKKKSELFLKLSRNNWHGGLLPNIKSESRENKNNIFSS